MRDGRRAAVVMSASVAPASRRQSRKAFSRANGRHLARDGRHRPQLDDTSAGDALPHVAPTRVGPPSAHSGCPARSEACRGARSIIGPSPSSRRCGALMQTKLRRVRGSGSSWSRTRGTWPWPSWCPCRSRQRHQWPHAWPCISRSRTHRCTFLVPRFLLLSCGNADEPRQAR